MNPSQKVIIIDSLCNLLDEADKGETIGLYYMTKCGDDIPLARLHTANNRQKGWQRKPEWKDQSNRHSSKRK